MNDTLKVSEVRVLLGCAFLAHEGSDVQSFTQRRRVYRGEVQAVLRGWRATADIKCSYDPEGEPRLWRLWHAGRFAKELSLSPTELVMTNED